MNPFEHNASEALAELITLANVKITKQTLIKALLKHPHFPSLASLKDVLTDCKIKTIAARGSIEKLAGLPLPALAFLTIDGGIFAPVRNVTDIQVEWYHTQNGWQNDTLYEFEQKWNGAILLIEPTTDSNEKNYNSKRIQELLTSSLLPVITIGILAFIGLLFWDRYPLYSSGERWVVGLLMLIKLVGAGLSGLLMWQSINPAEPVIRKNTSLIVEKRKNNSLLNSKGANLFNWLSWAETGVIYFVGSILGICIAAIFNEKIIGQLFLLSMISLPFTLYLFYYQAGRAKKWSLTCCTVLVLFWLEFVVCYYFLENFNFSESIQAYSVLGSYLFTISVYAVIKPVMATQKQWYEVIREIKRMKFNSDYVGSILKNNAQLPPVFESMKIIRVGDPIAKHTITLVCSPGSRESAETHNGLRELFLGGNDVYWRIIFLPTCEQEVQVMEAIFDCPEETALRSMDQWFADIDQPVQKWKDDLDNRLGLSDDEIKSQIALHASWCNLAKISTIPGLFINGVPIPAVYQTYDIPVLLNYLSKSNQQEKKDDSKLRQGMKIITCITNPEEIGYKHALKASCNFFNLDLITLTHPGKWDSHRHKDTYLKQYLLSLPGNEVVLFTDGYDTILLGGEKEIMERYRRIAPDGGIVISAEKTCYPDPNLASTYPMTNTPYRFLNSGGIIGTAADILSALAAIEEMKSSLPDDPFLFSNQYLWTRIMLKKDNSGIKLDVNCELFQTFPTSMETVRKFQSVPDINEKKEIVMTEMKAILQDFEVNDENIYNKITATYPLHLHFNGPVMKPAMLVQPFLSFINRVNETRKTEEQTKDRT